MKWKPIMYQRMMIVIIPPAPLYPILALGGLFEWVIVDKGSHFCQLRVNKWVWRRVWNWPWASSRRSLSAASKWRNNDVRKWWHGMVFLPKEWAMVHGCQCDAHVFFWTFHPGWHPENHFGLQLFGGKLWERSRRKWTKTIYVHTLGILFLMEFSVRDE